MNSIMDKNKIGIKQNEGKINFNDFSEAFQIDTVKNEPTENCFFTKCNSSSCETDFVDHKHTNDRYQEQKEEEVDVKDPNLDSDNFECPENSSSEYTTVQIKNEEDIDISYEDIKSEANQKKSSEVCYQCFGREPDFNSMSHKFECSCQNESFLINVCGEDMNLDVKPTFLGLTTVSRIVPLEIKDETISGGEGTEDKDSSVTPEKLKSLGNNFSSEQQMNDLAEKKFQCKICSKSFSNNKHLKVHERSHNGRKLSHCKMCSIAFTNSDNLKSHMTIHTGKNPFQCKICFKSFTRMYGLRMHEKLHTGEKSFHCEICSKSFIKNYNLQRHKRGHTGRKLSHCKICSKAFTNSDNLNAHMTIHIGEKKHIQCKFCLRSFTRLSSLKIHERIHTGEKPFHCEICSKSFRQYSKLKTHQKIHTSESPFHCTFCPKSFYQMGQLKSHEMVHTGEKPFHCHICCKSFSQQQNLQIHQRVHTGEKPFVCKVCSKSFRHAQQFKSHQRIHTCEKTLYCKICFITFTTLSKLNMHEKLHIIISEQPVDCKARSKSFSQMMKQNFMKISSMANRK